MLTTQPIRVNPRGMCGECGSEVAIRHDGKLRAHGFSKGGSGRNIKPQMCLGSGMSPTDTSRTHRPSPAGFRTACCGVDLEALPETDRISSDPRKVTCIGSSSTREHAVGW